MLFRSNGETFKIVTTESDQPICEVRKHEDAALIVCAHLMFVTLCFAAQVMEKYESKEDQKKFAETLKSVIRQANGDAKQIRYGATQ